MKIKKFIFFIVEILFLSISFAEGFSAGLETRFAAGFGTELKESELKKTVENFKNNGFAADEKPFCGLEAGIFARCQLPFYKPLGLQTDINFLYNSGCGVTVTKSGLSDIKIKYSYNSIDLDLLITYGLEYKNVLFTFMLGPDVSFPVGPLNYSYTFMTEQNSDYDIESKAIFGLTGGFSAGYRILKNTEAYALVKYLTDFNTLDYKNGSQVNELLLRRALSFGFGVRYIF